MTGKIELVVLRFNLVPFRMGNHQMSEKYCLLYCDKIHIPFSFISSENLQNI